MPRWVILGLLFLARCGAPPPQTLNPNESDQGEEDTTTIRDDGAFGGGTFHFVEDEDPEVAVLPFAEDEIIARILPGAHPDDIDAAYAELGVTVIEEIKEIQTAALRVEPDQLGAVATALAADPNFESVHKSYYYDAQATPNDPDFSRQSHLEAIGAEEAWEIAVGSDEMIIAILDTGVDLEHPDLVDRLIDGWNVHDDDGDPSDVLGHGTGVAGSAGASADNGIGVAGVSWANPLMPVRISNDKGRGSSRKIAAGIVWAVNHGARVINVSFAPLGSDTTVLKAAAFARSSGALVTISSGNNGKSYKAKADDSAIFVGAVDQSATLADFSNTGPFVDIVAPGKSVRTTQLGGGYGNVNGTSFASPIVAGVAALVWSVNPDFRPATVEGLLFDTAVDLGSPGRDDQYGAGLVDAAAAVSAALDVVEVVDTKRPQVAIIEPDDLEVVSGSVSVSVGAFDNIDIADVVLSLDGEAFATDTAAPFRFTVNTKRLANGMHTLSVVATDSSGNTSITRSVRITIEGGTGGGGSGSGGSGGSDGDDDSGGGTAGGVGDVIPPTVVINSPVEGASVLGSVGIQATFTDNVSLRSVEWFVDGTRQESRNLHGTRQVVSFLWNASTASKGPHRITIRVLDGARNEATETLNLIRE